MSDDVFSATNPYNQDAETTTTQAPVGVEFSKDTTWGFSALTEDEIRETETVLKKEVERHIKTLTETTNYAKGMVTKVESLRDLIMPFLNNLKNYPPEKKYIVWPNRVEQIGAFIAQIDKLVATG